MKKIHLVFFILLIFLTSCNKPKQTTENVKTTYSKYQPIVINSILIGGFFENKWIDQQKTFDALNITENYKVYKDGEYISDSIGEKIKLSKEDEVFSNTIKIIKLDEMKEKELDESNIVSVSGSFEVFKKEIIKMKNNNRTYKNIIKDILIENNMKNNNVIIKELYKFDIDNDDKSEYLIFASDIDDHTNNQIQKKYSIIVLRKMVDGVPKNIFLKKSTYILPYNEDKTFSQIIAIGDLNNDNDCEIVIKDEIQNYLKYSLHKLIDNKFEMLIDTSYSY